MVIRGSGFAGSQTQQLMNYSTETDMTKVDLRKSLEMGKFINMAFYLMLSLVLLLAGLVAVRGLLRARARREEMLERLSPVASRRGNAREQGQAGRLYE
jgi:hypothetical protein